MAVRRLTQIFFILTVCATLLVSSVAACACDHNRLATPEAPPSCHASSHTEPAAADTTSDNDRIDVGCNCPVSDPAVAALGKTENKKQKSSIPAAAASVTSTPTPSFRSNESRTVGPHSRTVAYSSPYGRSAPSRGPPLL